VQIDFRVEVLSEGTATVVALSGELDSQSRPAFEHQLDLLRESDWDPVILDLRSLEFIDARSLDGLIRAQEDAQRRGRRFGVVSGAQLESVMRLAGAEGSLILIDAPEQMLGRTDPAAS
jgi:anti-anti-sigma factor